jgi:hypothetical protein
MSTERIMAHHEPERGFWRPNGNMKAFSSESLPRTGCGVDAGSRKENASKQRTRASVLFQSEPIMLQQASK